MKTRAVFLCLCLWFANTAEAVTCHTAPFEDHPYTTCQVAVSEDLRLFHSGPDGVLGSFTAVDAMLAPQGKVLGFAMNAGMYHPDRAPVGLYIEQGRESARLITADGPGNFGLLPNGVFCIGAQFRVIESRAFKAENPTCTYATQSGPMLVIDGKLHPRFLQSSDSINYRNGVGVSADGQTAYFVISDDRVNFHSFARYFRDVLGVKDALFLDGSISRLYAPQIGRHDAGFAMGPIVGVVEAKE